ncbi:MAG TPA: 2-oxoacid:acceptor oxidoreductase subunit alpha [Deltaproteobacteria bacterium]|nr:2-oxoacid:acceptor oxidoreductase subunit alpha [Deltaproteobacteria bacterium]
MSHSSVEKKDDVSVVLCGEAGQGIQTVEQILTKVLKFSGYNIFGTKEYMSRVRGGSNSTQIRVSSRRVSSPVDRIDILIPFDRKALEHVGRRIHEDTVIIGEMKELFPDGDDKAFNCIDIHYSDIASDVGGAIYINTVATGVIAGLFSVDRRQFDDMIETFFTGSSQSIIDKNKEAGGRGYDAARTLVDAGRIGVDVTAHPDVAGEILMNGADAVGIGAIAGGCNFVASYPMSPSTAVLVFLAAHADEFGIVVEQAEDEIAAMNMTLGAWYAGARAMVTTSGGGFALMEEAVGLAGMLESPVVIHLAQRPGPATGLPTRTEQGDLQLALYSGHGEFPRIIMAPGSLEDAVHLSHRAFNAADKFQVPVFILTDQYLMDSYYNIPSVGISDTGAIHCFIETDESYKRYVLSENGVSPRGIPGFGTGLVSVDSDEHDEEGHITEDLDLRVAMADKRLAKMTEMEKDALPPELIGKDDYSVLIVGWGSTYHVIKEALTMMNRDDVSFLHFKQVYPLHPLTADYLKKARSVVVIEGNATGQFANLIKLRTGYDVHHRILKYNGLQYTVEEVTDRLSEVIE